MIKLVFNNDGSLYQSELPQYVTQGSQDIDSCKIVVAFKDLDINVGPQGPLVNVFAKFRLPNGEHSALKLNLTNQEFSILNRSYEGLGVYLTQQQTYYAGVLLVSIEVLDNTQPGVQPIIFTYNFKITVNPTTFNPEIIYDAQYDQLWSAYNELYEHGASKYYVDVVISEAQLGGTAHFDAVPTEDSDNAVRSGGVYSAIQDVVSDIDDGTLTAAWANNAINTSFTNNPWLTAEWDQNNIFWITFNPENVDTQTTIQIKWSTGNSITEDDVVRPTEFDFGLLSNTDQEISYLSCTRQDLIQASGFTATTICLRAKRMKDYPVVGQVSILCKLSILNYSLNNAGTTYCSSAWVTTDNFPNSQLLYKFIR